MGHQLIRQPNGLLCFFSSVTDSINGFDFTPEDYIEQEAKRAAFDTAIRVYQKALKIYADKPAYHQFSMDWDEVAHPEPCDCGECEGDEHDRTPKDEAAEWVANIERGKRAGGKPLPKFKPLELRRAPMCEDVIGVYCSGRLVGFVCKYSYAEGWYWETESLAYPGSISKGTSFLNACREVLQHGR